MDGSVAPLTRVTLAGPRRRVDLALPSDEPVGLLLPDILRLTAHRTGDDPVALGLAMADGRHPDRWPGQNLLGLALMRTRELLR